MGESNTLGRASLGLGIASSALVFGIGLCAWVGVQQGWIVFVVTPLYVCGASSAFLGFIGLLIGIGGLLSSGQSKATAAIGLVLSLLGMCIFFGILAAFGGG